MLHKNTIEGLRLGVVEAEIGTVRDAVLIP